MSDRLPCGHEFRGSHGPYHCHKIAREHRGLALGHDFEPWERRYHPYGRRATDARSEGLDAALSTLTEDDLMYDHPRSMTGEPMDPVLFVRWDAIRLALSQHKEPNRG